MYCRRCKNTGTVQEAYADFGTPTAPVALDGLCQPREAPIKTRIVECPDCLGFGAVGQVLSP